MNDNTWQNVYKKNNILFTIKLAEIDVTSLVARVVGITRCLVLKTFRFFDQITLNVFVEKVIEKAVQHSVRSIENSR